MEGGRGGGARVVYVMREVKERREPQKKAVAQGCHTDLPPS